MANEITSTTTSSDQEKFLAAKLIQRSYQRLVAASLCDKVTQPKGAGLTAYFIRYARMNIPVTAITEGTDPSNNGFSLEQVTCTQDQWGDYIIITDVAELTTNHPLLQQATELLSDNANRVIDREIQLVWLAGTNVQYGGSATARSGLAAGDKMTDAVLAKARVTMVAAGAAPRGGPYQQAKGSESSGALSAGKNFVLVCGPEVSSDIQLASTSLGTFASTAMYSNQKALYNSEVGTWQNHRIVESNFLPRFSRFGGDTPAVASGAAFGTGTPTVTAVDGGGSLTSGATYYYKVIRKSLQDGFGDEISLEHSTAAAATGNNESFTFAFSATAGYVYDLYFGSTTGDANLKLVSANIAAGTTTTVTAVSSSTTTPPVTPATGVTVSVCYVLAENACNWVGLQNMEVKMSQAGQATTSNPLALRRTIGYKFMAKAVVLDTTRLLRIEVVSTISY